MVRYLLLAAGFTALALGAVGIFLPLLPTTPFLLLSAGCFLRSSDYFYRWITNHRLFGRFIRMYLKYRAVSVRSKALSLILLWPVMMSTVIFFVEHLWLRLLLIAIASGVTVHILKIRNLTDEMVEEMKAETEAET